MPVATKKLTSISVLMPCLNPGQYLEPAIESVMAQPELTQLIVADGGSKPDTLESLEKWKQKDNRLEWFSAPDKGPADGLNKALAHARGDWIGWLNADDTYKSGAFSRALEKIDENPNLLMVYGHGEHIDSSGGFLEIYPSRLPHVGIEGFQQHCFICQPTVLLNRTLLKQVEGFNPQYKYAFDLDLWLRIFRQVPQAVGFVEAIQACTRIHKASITSRFQYQINLESAQLIKNSLGVVDKHWIETAASAYVSEHIQFRVDPDNTLTRETLVERSVQKEFEQACRRLYAEQQLAGDVITVRTDLPDMLRLILQSRVDLLVLEYDKPKNERLFCQWLITNGINEYSELFNSSNSLSPLFDWLLSPGQTKGMSRLEQGIWDSHTEHQRKWKGKNKANAYKAWLKENWVSLKLQLPSYDLIFQRRKRRKVLSWIIKRIKSVSIIEHSNGGVNVIGYATYALGIGEDARTCFHALRQVNMRAKLIDFQPGEELSERRELSLLNEVEQGEKIGDYKVSIVCLTAEETIRWATKAKNTLKQQVNYTIGYWPWELTIWPTQMLQALAYVDEVWVSTAYIAQGLKGHTNKPINVMPLCTETPECPPKPLNRQERKQARELFALPEQGTLFCFSFDLSSYISRKNPWACIKAFHRAFPPDLAHREHQDVGLVIKTYPPQSFNRDWEQLKYLAKLDIRIQLMETNLTRYQLLQLYGCCDGFLSLHRAEGFGRGIAEALQLGLDVVATDWSGNTDFCKGPLAHPIPYELVPVPPGAYPHWPGQVWAEPNIKAAADALRKIARRRRDNGLPAMELSDDYRKQFSSSTCGARYKKRLEELGLINET